VDTALQTEATAVEAAEADMGKKHFVFNTSLFSFMVRLKILVLVLKRSC